MSRSSQNITEEKEYFVSCCDIDIDFLQCKQQQHGPECDGEQPDCCFAVKKITCTISIGKLTSDELDNFLKNASDVSRGHYSKISPEQEAVMLVIPIKRRISHPYSIERMENNSPPEYESNDYYVVHADDKRSISEKALHNRMLSADEAPLLLAQHRKLDLYPTQLPSIRSLLLEYSKIANDIRSYRPKAKDVAQLPADFPKKEEKDRVSKMSAKERGKYFYELEENYKMNLTQIEGMFGFKRATFRPEIDAYRATIGLEPKIRKRGQPKKQM